MLVYCWCDTSYLDDKGKPSFRHSPYEAFLNDFADFAKPLLFTEFGCNLGEFETPCPYFGGRMWVDVPRAALFSRLLLPQRSKPYPVWVVCDVQPSHVSS